MLSYGLLKNHDGILLIGDYTSLRWLHEVVHDVNERSPLVRDKEGMFLGLAYDERKAYEQQREILQPHQHYEEIGVRYGVAGCETAPKVDPLKRRQAPDFTCKLATRAGSSSAPIVTPPDLHYISVDQGFTGPIIGVNLRR